MRVIGGGAAAEASWSDLLTTVNFSGATESNTGQRGASNSLGTSSTFDLAAVHGENNAGLDGYTAGVNVGAPPDANCILVVELDVTFPGSNSTGNTVGIQVAASHTATPTANKGIRFGAGMITTGSARRGFTPSKWGANTGTGGGNLGGSGTVKCRAAYVIADNKIAGVTAVNFDDGAQGDADYNAVDSDDLTSGVWLCLEGLMVNATPAAGCTFTDVVVRYAFLPSS